MDVSFFFLYLFKFFKQNQSASAPWHLHEANGSLTHGTTSSQGGKHKHLRQFKAQTELAIGSALRVGGSFTEPVTVAVNPKAGVYQMEKMKERWKELGKNRRRMGKCTGSKAKIRKQCTERGLCVDDQTQGLEFHNWVHEAPRSNKEGARRIPATGETRAEIRFQPTLPSHERQWRRETVLVHLRFSRS